MKFALSHEPIDAVLTIHFHNYQDRFGPGSFEKHMWFVLKNEHSELVQESRAAMYNFIVTYGGQKLIHFLEEYSLSAAA